MSDLTERITEALDGTTPGPWRVAVDDSAGKDTLELWVYHDDGSWVAGKEPPFNHDPFTFDPTPMERADAYLIAAAPSLLAEARDEIARLQQAIELLQRNWPSSVAPLTPSEDQ